MNISGFCLELWVHSLQTQDNLIKANHLCSAFCLGLIALNLKLDYCEYNSWLTVHMELQSRLYCSPYVDYGICIQESVVCRRATFNALQN